MPDRRCVPGVTALAAIVLLAFSAPATAQNAPLERGAFAGSVGIGGGRSLYLECHGRGSPTVILEAGLRSRSDFWSERTEETRGTTVLPGVARFTRVCAYDRPGTTLGSDAFSRSSPVPMPRTARDTVADLHALIRAAGIEGPVVLAGHSTGGLIARLYAATYPRQVAGLVMVDALSEFVENGYTPAQMQAFDELNNGPLPGLEAYTDLEQVLFRPSFAQMRRAARARPLRELPYAVLSRRLPIELPPGLPAGLTTELNERGWSASQRRLARLVPGTRQIVARRSSHYIMFSQPNLIIGAIRRVVREVRRAER